MTNPEYDVLVVGAGLGGLGAALSLAERGARVLLSEALRYPGGCASTFSRRGYAFDSGATLSSGFGPGQLFTRWFARHGVSLPTEPLDPVVCVRTPGQELVVPASREELLRRFQELPGAPREPLARFFRLQAATADLLWEILDRPEELLPLEAGGLRGHLGRLHRYPRLLRWVGRPLGAVLRAHGLERFSPLVRYLTSVSQITVQCPPEEAEAPMALATADYWFRGVAHIPGGIGGLAEGLVQAIRNAGGEVRLAQRVRSLERRDSSWVVGTRGEEVRARQVVANLLPDALGSLLEDPRTLAPELAALQERVEEGWGAVMLYRAVRPPAGIPEEALHLDLTARPEERFEAGNHVFCSLSGAGERERAPEGQRTMTVSTHIRLGPLLESPPEEQARVVQGVQDRMRATLAELAPEWEQVEEEFPASPRTFARFTGRTGGWVGGVPRRAGWGNYRRLYPSPVGPGLWLVGDSVFPGQSTLACALGGVKTAARVARSLGLLLLLTILVGATPLRAGEGADQVVGTPAPREERPVASRGDQGDREPEEAVLAALDRDLAGIDDNEAKLLRILSDAPRISRASFYRRLARHPGVYTRGYFMDLLRHHEDWMERASAAAWLGEIGPPEAARLLRVAARSDPDTEGGYGGTITLGNARAEARRALRRLGERFPEKPTPPAP